MKPIEALEARAAAMRPRLRLRAWEMRQLRGAKGSWHRLRRVLAHSREAFAVDDSTLEELLAEGFARDPVGDELEPRRSYVFVPAERAARLPRKRPLAVRLSAELLAAPNVVLVPFEHT